MEAVDVLAAVVVLVVDIEDLAVEGALEAEVDGLEDAVDCLAGLSLMEGKILGGSGIDLLA